MTTVQCSVCGQPLASAATRCPRCGAGRPVIVTPGAGEATWTSHAPTIIIFGPDQASGDTVHTVQTPEARSQARVSSSGTVSMVVEGPPGIGTSGEHRVAKLLRARLESDGVPSGVRPGVNERGKDRRIVTPQASYVLQVTTVPRDSALWQKASAGSGTTSVPTRTAAGWIESSIQHKAARTTAEDRARMILALDALHAGVLTEDAVVGSYLDHYGSPTERFNFASVWLVGPTAGTCIRLGAGSSRAAAAVASQLLYARSAPRFPINTQPVSLLCPTECGVHLRPLANRSPSRASFDRLARWPSSTAGQTSNRYLDS